jgi:hypothetical protein
VIARTLLVSASILIFSASLPEAETSTENQAGIFQTIRKTAIKLSEFAVVVKSILNATKTSTKAVEGGVGTGIDGAKVFGEFFVVGNNIQNNTDYTEYNATILITAQEYVDGQYRSYSEAESWAIRIAQGSYYTPFNKKKLQEQFARAVVKFERERSFRQLDGNQNGSRGSDLVSVSGRNDDPVVPDDGGDPTVDPGGGRGGPGGPPGCVRGCVGEF